MRPSDARRGRFPRGIPAASLKDLHASGRRDGHGRFPRGIPAASLKERGRVHAPSDSAPFSAGNTRGLIEGAHRRRGVGLGRLVFRGEYPRPH